MPSSRSASPISPSSEIGERRLAHPALALAVKLAIAPLLIVQAVQTRRGTLVLPEAAGPRDGIACSQASAGSQVLRVLVAGDSSAAGVGVADQERAVVGHLVRTLARSYDGPIAWSLRAKSGLTTRGVHAMLMREPPEPADVAVVISGVNDVLEQVSQRRATRDRAALADWLLERRLATHVVFAPLPPIHQFPLLREPLRRVLGGDARRHDRALGAWAATRGDVSHARIDLTLGAETMASDGFHPGEPVYRVCGEALGAHVARTAMALGK